MLLRSYSAPIPKSLRIHHSPSQSDRRATISFSTDNSVKNLSRTSSEPDVKQLLKPKENILRKAYSLEPVQELNKENITSFDHLQTSCGPGRGGGGGGDSGGDGGKNGGGGERFWDFSNWSWRERMDLHYRKMIEAYPGDALLLGNYARFLKEVLGDDVRAEEYCERAILAETDDGNVLSLYGDLIWDRHKDGARAQSYFDQALHNAPNNCYVHASYAKFLWDVAEEEEVEEGKESEVNIANTRTAPPSLHHGWPPRPPAVAAS